MYFESQKDRWELDRLVIFTELNNQDDHLQLNTTKTLQAQEQEAARSSFQGKMENISTPPPLGHFDTYLSHYKR